MNICVFCGASTGSDPRHAEAAVGLSHALAKQGLGLVFGGGRVGLMGVVADAFIEHGAETTGVIPTFLQEREVGHSAVSRLVITQSMHERKQTMFDLSEAFLVLPGGIGTLDETVEILTWRQLERHRKPVLLYNIEGYWQPFLGLIDHIIGSGFAHGSIADFYEVHDDAETIVSRLARLQAETQV